MIRPQRKSPRLDDYDHSGEGAYFVTVCIQSWLPLLGYVQNDAIHMSRAGHMIA